MRGVTWELHKNPYGLFTFQSLINHLGFRYDGNNLSVISSSFLKILFILERGKEGEREGEKHQCVVASRASPTGDLACNPGMCTDWESNQQLFGSQASDQSTEPHQPGQSSFFPQGRQFHPFTCSYPFPLTTAGRLKVAYQCSGCAKTKIQRSCL